MQAPFPAQAFKPIAQEVEASVVLRPRREWLVEPKLVPAVAAAVAARVLRPVRPVAVVEDMRRQIQAQLARRERKTIFKV